MRWLRWGVVAALIGVVGCGGKPGDQRDASGAGGLGGSHSGAARTYVQAVGSAVDILFLIDDSSEMRLMQSKLVRDFPTFVTTLQNLPQGLPDLHIGVISSDMGAGDGTVAGCSASGGKNGILQYTPRTTSPCAAALQAGATYIADGGGVKNYTGSLADMFGCIAALGETGCGFEHQLAAITRALGVDGLGAAPAENQGFLRPDAHLAVVLLTNEDDCSASPGDGPNRRIPLFDTAENKTITSQLGPPANFRCNEFGHWCDGSHPTRMAPSNDVNRTIRFGDCQSNDSEGYLLGTIDTANRIRALKTEPAKIMVASIQGPAVPYLVRWRSPVTPDSSCGAASCPWPEIMHSCTSIDTTFADPGVRISEFVAHFGADGLVLPICSDDYAPSLQRLAEGVGRLLAPSCITAQLEDNPGKPGLQPDCVVTAHAPQAGGAVVETNVPACDDSAPPCWSITRTEPACAGNASLLFAPSPASAAVRWLTVKCFVCTPGVSDPATCL